MEKKVCIVGAGTYGCYLANTIIDKYPETKVQILEVGNKIIKTEKEIGFKSILKKSNYKAAETGRFFGLGGTSSMWGGQLLFFSENDCPGDIEVDFLKTVNYEFKEKVLSRFFKKKIVLTENMLSTDLYLKKGLWLHFNKRNFYELFNIARKNNIEIKTNSNVQEIIHRNGKVEKLKIENEGIVEFIEADIFYLTAGAIESLRLLGASQIVNIAEESLGFADHVSMRSFRILGNTPIILGHDFAYKFSNKSMITSRIIGEIQGSSFYVQPVFNEEFILFQFLKNLIFKKNISFKLIKKIGSQIFYIVPFLWSYLIKNKLFVYKNWHINIDIELSKSDNQITNDSKVTNGIEISFTVPEETVKKLLIAKNIVREILISSNLRFEEIDSNTSVTKLEDTYHPYNMYKESKTFSEKFHPLNNLFVINTGILKRAGGLNPTAVLFCLIESHIEKEFGNEI